MTEFLENLLTLLADALTTTESAKLGPGDQHPVDKEKQRVVGEVPERARHLNLLFNRLDQAMEGMDELSAEHALALDFAQIVDKLYILIVEPTLPQGVREDETYIRNNWQLVTLLPNNPETESEELTSIKNRQQSISTLMEQLVDELQALERQLRARKSSVVRLAPRVTH